MFRTNSGIEEIGRYPTGKGRKLVNLKKRKVSWYSFGRLFVLAEPGQEENGHLYRGKGGGGS